MPRHDRTPLAIRLDEKNHVEEPFLQQLEGLNWEVLWLEMKGQKPEESFRDSLAEAVMPPRLREALHRINPWMEEDQIEEAARRITTPVGRDLIENNQHVLKLLLEGTSAGENNMLLTGFDAPIEQVMYLDPPFH